MKVICSKCKVEFNLDDRLIKEKGTKVRCTKCKHIFKVYHEGIVDEADENIWEDAFDLQSDPYMDMMREEFLQQQAQKMMLGEATDDDIADEDQAFEEEKQRIVAKLKEVKPDEIKSDSMDNAGSNKAIAQKTKSEKPEDKSVPEKAPEKPTEKENTKDKPIKDTSISFDLEESLTEESTALDKIKSIAFLSGKGGTGKTSIAASISYVLAHCGFKTLIVDIDLFTYGMTFYSLGEYPKKNQRSLSQIFADNNEDSFIDPILITNTFTNGNLFLLPSISSKDFTSNQLYLGDRYNSLKELCIKLKQILEFVITKHKFEYILIDTRGGTDHTNIGAAFAAKEYIVITEPDKPSWEMGKMLIDTIDEAETKEGMEIKRTGFVINKNVLPANEIEAYLQKIWKTPHFGTIPLDENVIKCFQEKKVAIDAETKCPFSKSIYNIIKKSGLSKDWPLESISKLNQMAYTSIFDSFLRFFK